MNCEYKFGGEIIPKMRDERIDSVKFYLILLVVLGHILEMWQLFPEIYRFIYSFHMPLFVFISGYFSKPQRLSSFWRSNKKIIIVFLLTHIFVCLTGDIVKYYGFGFGGNPWITPWFALWYLFALLLYRLSLNIVKPQLNRRSLIIVFILAIIIGFIPIGCEFSLIRAISYYPFFFIGAALHGKDIYPKISKIPIGICLFILITAITFCYFIHIPSYVPLSPYSSLYSLVIRTFWLFAAFPISISFLRICPNVHFFALIGKHTLTIYVIHMFALNFLLYYMTSPK